MEAMFCITSARLAISVGMVRCAQLQDWEGHQERDLQLVVQQRQRRGRPQQASLPTPQRALEPMPSLRYTPFLNLHAAPINL